MEKYKLFISQPMADKTDEQIQIEKEKAIEDACMISGCVKEDIEVIDSFIKDAPENAKPLWFLGESLKFLSEADGAYFVDGWKDYRGCKIEHICAEEYGINIISD